MSKLNPLSKAKLKLKLYINTLPLDSEAEEELWEKIEECYE